MSHEIRSPLNSIIGFMRQLEGDLRGFAIDKESRKGVDESLMFMKQGSDRLTDLINGLLDISKLEAGKVEFRFQSNDMLATIRAVIGELSPQAEEKKVRMKLSNNDPLELAFDGGKITQVLINLIGNALKFTPQGGLVTISFAEIDLLGKKSVSVSIVNEGRRIDDKKLFCIFNRFMQDGGQCGAGLGLAISREIILAHGGEIEAENVEIGVKFTFTLPFKQAKE